MPQLAHFDKVVQDGSGNAVVGASVQLYREGASVNGAHSSVAPATITVRHRGRIAAADTVFIGTASGTTYSVDSVTATTVVLSGFGGTLVLSGGERIVPSNSLPTLYSDDQGGATKANPLTSSATGRVDAFMENGVYEQLSSGSGLTTTLDQAVSVMSEGPAVVYSSETDSATAVAHVEDTRFDLTTAGAKLKSWRKAGTEKAYLDKDGSLSISGNFLIGGLTALATSALGNVRWAHMYDNATSETDGIQEAINSITDSSATNPYTVMLRPGIYTVDVPKDGGTQTGTADFTTNGVTVTGTGTKFKSTQTLTGTVTMTTSSVVVTGSGTLFLTELQVGDHLQMSADVDDGAGADRGGTFGRVKSIESNTALTLAPINVYSGAGGTGAARFREFRVNDHIRAGAHAATADTRITSIASDTSLTISGTEAIPPVTGYQGATLAGAAVHRTSYEHTGIVTQGTGADGAPLTGGSAKDYIAIAGMDRESCIIRRNKAANALTAVIQMGDVGAHQSFSNLTIWSCATRHIHWDTAGGYLIASRVNFRSAPAAANSAGVSTGIQSTPSESVYHKITDCHFQDTLYAVHSGAEAAGSLVNFIWVTGCTFTASGNIIGLDMGTANANSSFNIMLSGNMQQTFNVDHGSGSVNLIMPTTLAEQPRVRIYTDGSLGFGNSTVVVAITNDTADYYFNAIIYPMEFRKTYQTATGVTSGDVIVYRPATGDVNTTTTANSQWPAVCCNQSDNTASAGWFPRLCTGPYGACFVESAQAVTPGDTLVTSVTAKDAFVNNAQTDLTRIIGWAYNGKTAGARRLVHFRRNMTLAW